MNSQVSKSPIAISDELAANELTLKAVFRNCSDVIFRPLHESRASDVLMVYVEEFIDAQSLGQAVTTYLRTNEIELFYQYKQANDLMEVVAGILSGKVAILVDGAERAFLADFNGTKQRSIEEPSNESAIRGPREAFTEALQTNIGMIRRKLSSSSLKFEAFQVGTISNTRLAVAYIEGKAAPDVLNKVRERIQKIHTDQILDSEYIEEYIEDAPYSLFPQARNTERPDSVAASLVEGKVAIIVDGSPNALLVPMTFWNGFQSADDHYERFQYVSALRLLRLLLALASALLPSIYVSLTTFHPQMIPLNLMLSIAASREGIPFPTVIETLLMEILFEGLREAGLRLPKAIGSAISIVGALVIGEAAVQAGFISAPIVMIVAGTGIASFVFPNYSLGLPFRLLRFPLLLFGGFFGLYGVAMGVVFIISHLVCLTSLGVPYFSPVAPFSRQMLKDTLVRMHKRQTLENR